MVWVYILQSNYVYTNTRENEIIPVVLEKLKYVYDITRISL